MAITAASNALATITQVKSWLNLTTEDVPRDDFLQDQINHWSGEFERRTSRIVAAGDYVSEQHDSNRRSIMVNNPPINSVASIYVSSVELGADSFFIIPYGSMVRKYDGTRFRGGPGDILISYNGGFSATPGDIARTLIQIIAIGYYLSGHGVQALAKRGESTAGGSITFNRGPEDQEKLFRSVINRYMIRHG